MDTVHDFGVCLFVILVSVINGYSQTTVRGEYFVFSFLSQTGNFKIAREITQNLLQ